MNDAAISAPAPVPAETKGGRASLRLPLSAIYLGERLRPINPEKVAEKAVSMREQGLLSPIEVRQQPDGRWRVVFGGHRFVAAGELGWTEIDVLPFEGTEDEATLREIDENLYHHDLNPLDEAVFLAKRQEIYLRLYPETKHGGDRKSDQVSKLHTRSKPRSFADDVAARTGLHRTTISRALNRARDIHSDALALVRGTWIARKGSALDQLRDVPKADQARVAEALLSDAPNRPRTVREARRIVLREQGPAPADPLKKLQSAIENLSVEDRVRLVEWMGNRSYLGRGKRAGA